MANAAQPFLFMFGFESPAEHVSNERDGTDFESSWAVWISADDGDAALAWGREIAERFVGLLYERAGMPARSWINDGFAHWVSDDARELESARSQASIPSVPIGQMPDFSWALEHWTR